MSPSHTPPVSATIPPPQGTSLHIDRIAVLQDNYVWLVHDPKSGKTAVIDPAVAMPVMERADALGWRITHIFNTHHHADHTGGNLDLKAATGCVICGPGNDRARIAGIDIGLGEGDTYAFGSETARIFDVPGHTRGHIAWWFEQSQALFCGDTLFAMGCGRLFEGTPEQMLTSLHKLKALPQETRVFCAHEYTEANGTFALSVEPQNRDLQARMEQVRAMRQRGEATIPSLLKDELATNPFLRSHSVALQETIGLVDAPLVDVFAETRRRKDNS